MAATLDHGGEALPIALPTRARSLGLQAAFLFYTGGFYLYSVLVYHGMPAFMRGFLVLGAAACIPLVGLPYLKVVRHPGSRRMIDVLIWLMLGYFFVWMLVVGAPARHPGEFRNYVGSIISWIMLFMLGRSVPVYSKGLTSLAWVVLAGMVVLTVANTENGAFTPAQSPDTYATYQAYALVVAIVSFVLLYEVKRAVLFWIIAVSAVILFAILGSRSEMVAALLAILVVVNLRRISASKLILHIGAGAALVAAFIALTSTGWNRLVNLVDEGAASAISSRFDASREALATIARYPLTGDFASYPAGFYAHNILSVWVDFGLVGIVLYSVLLFVSIWALLLGAPAALRERKTVVAVALWWFCAVLLLLTKAGDYFIVPFVMGLIASHCAIRSPRTARAPRHRGEPCPSGGREGAM
jgi:hypothetical protein